MSSGLAKVLEDWQPGIQVTIATDIDAIPENALGAGSAVLLDLDLGEGIEFETLRTLKAKFPNIPVIIFSGSTDPLVIKRSQALGSSAFIRKGENVERILEIIDLVVDGGNSVFPDTLVTQWSSTEPENGALRRLTRRERDVFHYLCKGGTNKEIAQTLGIEEKTVRAHLTEIYRKLGVKNRTEAILL